MKGRSDIPERLLVIGSYGVGKSQCWVTWAAAQRTSGTGRTFVVNADRPGMVELANAKYPGWEDNITHSYVNGWTELRDTTASYVALTQPGDLFVIDGIELAWEWVRALYVETENRKANRTLDESDPFAMLPEVKMDWEVINAAYFRFYNLFQAHSNPAHVMLVGASQPLKVKTDTNPWGDDKETLDLFSPWGVRPAGQKGLGKMANTVLLATRRQRDYVLDTMKETDSTREYMVKEVVPPDMGFPLAYLVGKAGWTL